MRKIVKKRDKGLCRLCDYAGILKEGTDVHHIDPCSEAMLLALDPGNHILLCEECHVKITGHERRWMRKLFKILEQPMAQISSAPS